MLLSFNCCELLLTKSAKFTQSSQQSGSSFTPFCLVASCVVSLELLHQSPTVRTRAGIELLLGLGLKFHNFISTYVAMA